ncbi:hypothetical protein GGI16_001102, partial [Coemansia sp. S142-1]
MSNHLSPAQALPIDVLHSILKWVTLEEKSPLHGYSLELENVKELLTVSSTWRQVALEFLWRKLDLNIDVSRSIVRLYSPEWVGNNALPHNAVNLVKKISINVLLSDIVSGKAHRLLDNYIGNTKCFPLANRLTLTIVEYMDYHADDKDMAIANALEFAKLLKSMAPSSMTIELSCYGDDWQATNNDLGSNLGEEVLGALADVLYANTKCTHLLLREADVNPLAVVNFIPPLSSLTMTYMVLPDMHTSLAHKSASTLQYLEIALDDANTLVFDQNGEAVVYPSMQYLQLSTRSSNSSNVRVMSSTTTPFPVLRSLKLDTPYPFDDDVLFRGNTATLKSLGLFLHYNAIVMLNKKRVFENRQLSLQSVCVYGFWTNRDNSDTSEMETNKFLDCLMAVTKRIKVPYLIVDKVRISAIKAGQVFNNITVFEVHQGSLSIFEMLSTLKALPALANFRGGISGLGPELESVTADELPDYIASTY